MTNKMLPTSTCVCMYTEVDLHLGHAQNPFKFLFKDISFQLIVFIIIIFLMNLNPPKFIKLKTDKNFGTLVRPLHGQGQAYICV